MTIGCLLNYFKAVLPSPVIPTSQCMQDILSHFISYLFSYLPSDFLTYNCTIRVMGFTHNSLSALWIYYKQPSNVTGLTVVHSLLLFFSLAFAVSSFLTYLSSNRFLSLSLSYSDRSTSFFLVLKHVVQKENQAMHVHFLGCLLNYHLPFCASNPC